MSFNYQAHNFAGSDYGVNIEDQGPKNRPVQEVVRKQKQSDIQFMNRLLPNLVQENASGLQVCQFPIIPLHSSLQSQQRA